MTLDFKVEKDSSWIRQCAGIDMAKKKFNACLCIHDIKTNQFRFTKSVEFSNDKQGFNQFIKWSRKEGLKDFPMTYLVEPTGVYYEPLAYHLHKIGQTVYVVLPNKARDFCNYQGIKTKTDEMDSRCLAMLGCMDRTLRAWEPPKAIYRELRQMTRFVEEIQKVRTMLMNHLEALNHSESPEKSVIKHYVKLIADIDKQLIANEKQIREKIATDKELEAKVKRLCTIKGAGYITVVTIIAETNGFALINNRKQLASFAGLDVKAEQSGTQDPKHHITKKGNTHIRRVLYFPAVSASRFNPQMMALYKRVCEYNPNVKKIGLTAIMRKILLLIYTLWKSGEEYDPKRNGKIVTIEDKIEEAIGDEGGISLPSPLNAFDEATSHLTLDELDELGIEIPF